MDGSRVVLVTGTSSGIGAAIKVALTEAGWRVFGSCRGGGTDTDDLRMDVTDDSSVQDAVAAVIHRAGRLDAVVNNAGVDMAGAVEETTVDEAQALFDTNFFGVHRVTREVLPHLRQQGDGRIIVIGSLAGLVPVPFDACYAATKHALRGWIESLQFEVAAFGVRCTIVEPGFVRTQVRERKHDSTARIASYDAVRNQVQSAFDRSVSDGMPPEHVARAVTALLMSRRPPLHRRIGFDAHRTVALHTILPNSVFHAGMRRRFT